MKRLISLLKNQHLRYNQFYKNYEIKEDTLLIRKSEASFSSAIEVKEMINLFEVFAGIEGVDFCVLENGDIYINKLKK